MKYLICLISLITLSLSDISAQSFYRIDDYCFGTTRQEKLAKVIKTGSHYYLVGASNCQKSEWDKSENNCDTIQSVFNSWTISCDSSFNKNWDKTYGGQLSFFVNDAISYKQGILICGYTSSDSSCTNYTNGKGALVDEDFIMYYLDTMGNKLNEMRLGSFGSEHECKVIETNDKGLLIAGASSGQATGDKSQNNWGVEDYWVIKLDSLGNKQWDNSFGGNDREQYIGGILPLIGDNYLIYGQTFSSSSGYVSGSSFGGYDGWLVKIDNTGSRVWDKRFGGTGGELISKVLKIDDYYYLLGVSKSIPASIGTTTHPGFGLGDIWLMKTDTNGNLLWETKFGSSLEDFGIDMIPNNNGGIFILGHIYTAGSGSFPSVNYGSDDFVIMSIDTAGTLLSYKILGTIYPDIPSGMLAINDSTLLLYGSSLVGTSDVKLCAGHLAIPPLNNAFNRDYWIIKVGYGTATTSLNQLQNNLSLTVRPNPAKDHIDISGLPLATYTINTYSLDGRLVISDIVTSDLSLPLSIEYLQSGMYITSIRNEKINTTVRWVKE
ncbi:MAG: hypothetical protein RL516_1392 [Bacteroidota bacterium]|jgi:hypothetical protein